MIKQEHLDRSMSYTDYVKLLNDLMEQGKTTGSNQSEYYLNYAKLNLQRMHRLDKTTELMPELKKALTDLTSKYILVALTEGWCGDAAQNLPVIHAMEKETPNLELRCLLRDENLDVMDQYLTDGRSRSIPKVICIKKDPDSGEWKDCFVWGPRPEGAQALMHDHKEKGIPHDETSLEIQKWYNADKTMSTQKEFLDLITTLR